MSGIVAVLPVSAPNPVFDLPLVLRTLEAMRIPSPTGRPGDELALGHVRAQLVGASCLLSDPRAEPRLLANSSLLKRLRLALTRLELAAETAERRLTLLEGGLEPRQRRATQHALVRIAASLWSLRHDRLSRAEAVGAFLGAAGDGPGLAPSSAVTGYGAIETALRGIDRLEGQGRDSAGLHVWVRGPSLTQLLRTAKQQIKERRQPRQGGNAVELAAGGITFTYQVATVNAQFGDNVAALREAIANDTLLRRAMNTLGANVSVLAHSRSAGVGRISGARVDARHDGNPHTNDDKHPCPYTVAVLNGDNHDHGDPRIAENISTGPETITDAARIPALLARTADGPDRLLPAFADIVSSFTGSLTIAVQSEHDPDALLLGVRGSGQSLYVGFSSSGWLVASEPYGLIGDTERYLGIDGTPGAENFSAGRVVLLRREHAGELAGVRRYDLDRQPLPVAFSEIETAEITSRNTALGTRPSKTARQRREPARARR